MKIQCPHCQLTGQISDVNVPAEGLNMDCPRCKESFFVEKTAARSWHETLADCPACKYSTFSEERFDICPKCGLDAKKYNEEQQARRARGDQGGVSKQPVGGRPIPGEPYIDPAEQQRMLEEARRKLEEDSSKRKYGFDMPPPSGMAAEPVPVAELPQAVQVLGWIVIAASAILFLFSLKELYGYITMPPPEPDPIDPENVPGGFKIFLMNGLTPSLGVLFGVASALCAAQFLQLRSWSRKALEWLSWGALGFSIIYEAIGLVGWVRRSSSAATFGYYFVGVITSMLMMLLWVAPLLALLWFLRNELITSAFDE